MSDSNFDDMQALRTAIGYFVITWGQIESMITASLDIIYKYAPSQKPEKSIPPGLGRKIKLLKKCLKKMPELQTAQAHGEALIDKIDPLKNQREVVIHGALRDTVPTNGVFYFSKLDFDDEKYEMNIEKFDLKIFPNFVLELEGLAISSLSLQAELQKILLR